jgi:hypothetical protein
MTISVASLIDTTVSGLRLIAGVLLGLSALVLIALLAFDAPAFLSAAGLALVLGAAAFLFSVVRNGQQLRGALANPDQVEAVYAIDLSLRVGGGQVAQQFPVMLVLTNGTHLRVMSLSNDAATAIEPFRVAFPSAAVGFDLDREHAKRAAEGKERLQTMGRIVLAPVVAAAVMFAATVPSVNRIQRDTDQAVANIKVTQQEEAKHRAELRGLKGGTAWTSCALEAPAGEKRIAFLFDGVPPGLTGKTLRTGLAMADREGAHAQVPTTEPGDVAPDSNRPSGVEIALDLAAQSPSKWSQSRMYKDPTTIRVFGVRQSERNDKGGPVVFAFRAVRADTNATLCEGLWSGKVAKPDSAEVGEVELIAAAAVLPGCRWLGTEACRELGSTASGRRDW